MEREHRTERRIDSLPCSQEIVDVADGVIERWHRHERAIFSIDDAMRLLLTRSDDHLLQLIEQLAVVNTTQWHEEDKARDVDATDTGIATIKRVIDRLNARRVATVEEIDEGFVRHLPLNEGAPLNTETPGSVVDRLTILCLKHFHMSLEASREDAPEEHRQRCAGTVALIEKQKSDLMSAYDTFIEDVGAGNRRFARYRQFKMYNDPDLNPVLYRKKGDHREE